jgi:carbonic anhydrase
MLNTLLLVGHLLAMPAQAHEQAVDAPTPVTVLAELKAGNKRYLEGKRTRSLRTAEDAHVREVLATGQHPLAAIVCCSDSRVVDSFIFDQEPGRLFTVREAGNSPDIQGIASVEYAVEHLGCKLVVVMGHTSCGAVKAVADANGAPLPGNLWVFQASMAGLLESTPKLAGETPSAYQKRLARVNAVRQAKFMTQRSAILKHELAEGEIKILPALYDLASGSVTFLDEAVAPQEEEPAHH